MDELFENYPQEKEFELIVPQSRWARVPTENKGYYVVGIVFNPNSPQFISKRLKIYKSITYVRY